MASNDQRTNVWTIGSYADIGPNFLGMAAHLVEAAGVEADQHVLDVACGTGNVAFTAARRGARVTGLDITPAMLEEARANASIADLEAIEWRQGDATDLPFDANTFDVVLSCVGHMFATPPTAAAEELLRVTRPGGRVAFTAWTPRSVVPAMGEVMQAYLPPDPDAPPPPVQWGDPAIVRDRLGAGVTDIEFETGTVDHLTMSPGHYWEAARTQSGLFIVALDNVDPDDRPALREETIEAIDRFFDERKNTVAMEYRLAKATVA